MWRGDARGLAGWNFLGKCGPPALFRRSFRHLQLCRVRRRNPTAYPAGRVLRSRMERALNVVEVGDILFSFELYFIGFSADQSKNAPKSLMRLRSGRLNKETMVAPIADHHVACMHHGHALWRKGSLSTSGQVQAAHKRPVQQKHLHA